MNTANVDAITAALATSVPRYRLTDDEIALVAVQMAHRGVLAPSALTDKEAAEIASISDFTISTNRESERGEAAQVRSALERIARGEG